MRTTKAIAAAGLIAAAALTPAAAVTQAAAAVPVKAAAAGSGASSGLSAQDLRWLRYAAAADLTQIRAGHTAESQAARAAVKNLGARLLADHTMSADQLRQLAAKLGAALPSGPTAAQRAAVARLAAMHGSAFGAAYVLREIADHRRDLAATLWEATHGSQPQVMAQARRELPVLRAHLRMAELVRARLAAATPSMVNAGSGGTADTSPLLPDGAVAALAAFGAGLTGWGGRRLLARRG